MMIPSLSWSQDNKLVIIRKIQGAEKYPPHLMKQLEKISLQVVTRQPHIELMLSPNDMPENTLLDLAAVESDISKENNGYVIELKLVDVRTKKLINTASLKRIREDDLQRLFESALQSLFDPWIKSFKKKESIQLNKSPSALNPGKKKTSKIIFNDQQDAAAIDFKQRVKDLKLGVDDKIDEVNQIKVESNKAKDSTNSSESNEQIFAREAEVKTELKLQNPKKEVEYESKHKINISYDYRSIQSLSLIETTTTSTLLNLNASGTQPLGLFKGKAGASYEVSYARSISVPAEINPPYKFGLYGTHYLNSWDLSIGYVRESLFFINLPSPGAGLESENINANWLELKLETKLDYKGKWDLLASYASSLSATTTYAPLKNDPNLSGNKIKIAASPPYQYAKWRTDASLEKISLKSQGDFSFTLNETRYALSLRRSF